MDSDLKWYKSNTLEFIQSITNAFQIIMWKVIFITLLFINIISEKLVVIKLI